MTNINNSLNKEELCKCGHKENQHYNKVIPTGKMFKCWGSNKETGKYCLCGKFEEQTAEEIIKDSPILEEDKTDLLLTKTIKGKYKRSVKK